MEGLSGSRFNDVLTGSERRRRRSRCRSSHGGTEGFRGSALDAEGIALIAGLQAVLGRRRHAPSSAGDIILGGDGSDMIKGRGGDDIIDGDKWLDVQIGVFAAGDAEHTGTPIALHNSMTTLAASMFSGSINPGQLGIVRTIRETATMTPTRRDCRCRSSRCSPTSGPNTTSRSIRTAPSPWPHTGGLATDGTDTLRNVEVLRLHRQDISC